MNLKSSINKKSIILDSRVKARIKSQVHHTSKTKTILYTIAYKNIIDTFNKRNLNEIATKNLPKPETMLGIKEASSIIAYAIKNNKKIGIVGDYDVDGVSSSCIINLFFKKINFYNYELKIPNRFKDGYGINENIIDSINAELYITLDNGISAFEVAEHCKERNKILIITDHHKPRVENDIDFLPNAKVIVNPSQKKCKFMQKEVCGAVVAWYLCAGIKTELGLNNIKMQDFSPFLSLAIISDVMPLISINRTLFKMGIKMINNSVIDYSLPAFALLKEKFGTLDSNSNTKKIDSQSIGFYIAPLLNSAGRLEDASLAYNFLLQEDKNKASLLFNELSVINEKRKKIQNDVFLEARKNIKTTTADSKFLLSYKEDWNEGVLGIVASKLADEFAKSAFCLKLDNGILKGSGRSYGDVNLIESISSCSSLLLGFGGHSGAVGLSLELKNLEKFMETLEQNIVLDSKTKIDSTSLQISLNAININLLELLESYEPYGNANEIISFQSNNIKVLDSRIIGNNHQILMFKNNVEAILFNDTKEYKNSIVDIKFMIQKNKYAGTLQLMILNIKQKSGI